MGKIIDREPAFLRDLHKIRAKMSRKAGYDVHRFAEMVRNDTFIEKKEDKPKKRARGK